MTAEITVTLLDHMGTDATVLDAARASFNKAHTNTELSDKDYSLLKFLARGYTEAEWQETAAQLAAATDPEQIKVIMWELRTRATHFAPFCHPQMSFRITAPLYVARQLWKSHVGAAGGDAGYPAWSEISRRYIDAAPEFYIPETWRKRADNVKQGSSDEVADVDAQYLRATLSVAEDAYTYLRDHAQVAPEQARGLLPTCMMVTWVWTGSLMFFARVCHLRLDTHAQQETRFVARYICDFAGELFPASWDALLTGDIYLK